jgi:hypothetical protein
MCAMGVFPEYGGASGKDDDCQVLRLQVEI